jgi:hypothetical protein
MVVVQELSDCDMTNRNTVAERLIGTLSDDVIFFMRDRQNFRYGAEENPQHFHQQSFRSLCVTAYCGVAKFGVIGPYFFEDEYGPVVTVTFARYVEILR